MNKIETLLYGHPKVKLLWKHESRLMRLCGMLMGGDVGDFMNIMARVASDLLNAGSGLLNSSLDLLMGGCGHSRNL